MNLQRSTLTAIFSATLALATFCQTKTDRAEVQWAAPLDVKKDGSFLGILHSTEDHVYVMFQQKKESFIKKLDRNYKVIAQQLLPMKFDKDQHVLEEITFVGDKMLVFTTYFDKKAKLSSLYMRAFDQNDLSPLGKMEKMNSLEAESNSRRGGISVYSSPGNKKFLVDLNKTYTKDENERSEMLVYNSSMELDWSQEILLPYPNKEFSRRQTIIDDDGSILMLGIKYDEKKEAREKKKEKLPTYTYHLLIVQNSGQIEDHPLKIDDKFLQDMSIAIAEDGDIICGGLFGNKGASSVRGSYFMSLDRQTKSIAHQSYKDFDKDFITSYMTEKQANKAEKKADRKGEDVEMAQFDMDQIVLREDGGAVLVGEQFYTYQRCYTDSKGRTRCYDVYVYNDIIVINVDPNGEIEWAALVPKRQSFTIPSQSNYLFTIGSRPNRPVYASYAMAVKNDNIHLVFNDNGKNLFLKPGMKVEPYVFNRKGALITLATVDGSGIVHREALLKPEKKEAILQPLDCRQIDNDNMFIYATRGREYRFGSINFH